MNDWTDCGDTMELTVIGRALLRGHTAQPDDERAFRGWLARVHKAADQHLVPACLICRQGVDPDLFGAIVIVRGTAFERVAPLCLTCAKGPPGVVLDRLRPVLASQFNADIHLIH